MKRERRVFLVALVLLPCLTTSTAQDATSPRDGRPREAAAPSGRPSVGLVLRPGVLIPILFPPRSAKPAPAEGNAFTVVLPAAAWEGALPLGEVLGQIEPTLRSAGFQRSLSDLALPAEPTNLGGADVRALAAEVCREDGRPGGDQPGDEKSRAVCAALRESGQPSRLADDAMRDAVGTGLLEWKADLERARYQYVFTQTAGGVPIERAMVTALRREGETVSLVHGALLDSFRVVNQADRSQLGRVLETARAQLAVKAETEELPVQLGEPELVLLPGEMVKGETVLRHAWRVLLGGRQSPKSWMVWADAATGNLLRMAPQWSEAAQEVSGVRWRRDPGSCSTGPCTEPVRFKVDPLPNGRLALQLNGVFPRVDVGADGFLPNGFEIEVSSAADLLKSPIAGDANALCSGKTGGNRLFRQVNAYSHVYSFREIARSAGSLPTFPEKATQIYIDVATKDSQGSVSYYDSAAGRDARSSLWIAEGQGHTAADCPAADGLRLNGAQDATILAHEAAHLLMWRLQERRPQSWCGSGTCSLPDPLSHGILHNVADGLAFLYAGTNCFAGWSAKNLGGKDASLGCRKHSEDGGFPRLAELPADRFPEHRRPNHEGEYANGQIAAAALWDIRQGLFSKAGDAGVEELWVRLLRSLRSFGFQKLTCSSVDSSEGRPRHSSCDRDVFLQLQDLERKMMGEWTAAPGPGRQTASKVLSGWAKAGVFLTPIECLDGKAGTKHPHCPAADTAVDAVIEIDDRDPAGYPAGDPEVDYLKKAGPPPGFRIWTGPHYRFTGAGAADTTAPLCGQTYEVEAASDAKFTLNLWKSGVRSTATCQADVVLDPAAWNVLRNQNRLFYRVTTKDQQGTTRVSTAPGAGTFPIEPPFAAINASGSR